MARRFVLALLVSIATFFPAHAQVFRAYVSSEGSDSNPCSLPAPCRLLPAAVAAVAPGGEIWMLDSANYNTATVAINKSVTILAVPGVVGSVVAINAGSAMHLTGEAKVTLRNLVITNFNGTGAAGITHSGSGELNVFDCDISGLTGSAALNLNPVNVLKVNVRGSVLRGNGSGIIGVGLGQVTVERSQLSGNDSAIFIGSRMRVTVANSVLTGNNKAIYAQTFGQGQNVTTSVEVEGTTFTNNQQAIEVQSFSTGDVMNLVLRGSLISGSSVSAIKVDERAGTTLTAVIDNNSIINNNVAFDWGGVTTGAQVLTRGNNVVRMNTTEILNGGAYTPLGGT